MKALPDCKLTQRDLAILTALQDHSHAASGIWLALLQKKLQTSTIELSNEFPRDRVTLDSLVSYQVDGCDTGPHLLVPYETADLPPFALSVHSIRGLSLLGLAEGNSVTVPNYEGGTETLTVVLVLSQPNGERIDQVATTPHERENDGATVISFAARRSAGRSRPVVTSDDDDPGPYAA